MNFELINTLPHYLYTHVPLPLTPVLEAGA